MSRLLAGATVSAAAEAVGVDRTTVHRWQKDDFHFQAALNRGKQELRDAAQARLLQATTQAAETVAQAVEQGDLKAALGLLKGLGLLSGGVPAPGLDDPEGLRQAAAAAREEAELTRHEQEHDRMLRRMMYPG